jgi:hypothetical protein
MLREAPIPLALWLPAALLVHAASGGGAVEAARVQQERQDIVRFARGARAEIRASLDGTTNVAVIELKPEQPPPGLQTPQQQDDQANSETGEATSDRWKPRPKPGVVPRKTTPPSEPEPVAKKKATTPKPKRPPAPKVAPKRLAKRAKIKQQPSKKAAAAAKLKPLPRPDGRIAIINDPSLKKQKDDNKQAKRIADRANTTKAETMARFRSYDQNSPKPSGGGKPNKVNSPEQGNAASDKAGHSHETPGQGSPRAGVKVAGVKRAAPAAGAKTGAPENAGSGREARNAVRGRKASAQGKGKVVPQTVAGAAGKPWINPEGGDNRRRSVARQGRRGRRGRRAVAGKFRPGLPARYGASAGMVRSVVGRSRLAAEQQQARNTRLRKHRGKFKGASFKKYRAAIENYDPTVKAGNQTNLNAARVPFASYINGMHNRIHPIFADGFLGSLSGLDPRDRLSNMKLVTHVEIVLDGKTGKLIRAGVVKPSGVTAFEVAALRSLEDASPYGAPPKSIVSPGGRVYLHWEFYRDPYFACTSRFARPYLLKRNPNKRKKTKNPPPRPPQPQPPRGESTSRPLRPER